MTTAEERGRRPKSYWSSVCCNSDRDRQAVLSWFSPLCDGMTPIKAEILCDIETDREKKIRALMRDDQGRERWAVRTKGARTYSISLAAESKRP